MARIKPFMRGDMRKHRKTAGDVDSRVSKIRLVYIHGC